VSASAVRPGDSAAVSVRVAVSPADAFEVFTGEIDLWWRHGSKFRIAGRRRGSLHLEPGVGGRLFETFESSAGPRTIEVGRMTSWKPPARMAFEWRGVNFKPDEKTLVEVLFEPSGEGTLVTVRHSGWSALPDDHPARHGAAGAAFSRHIGMWWADLMASLREHVVSRGHGGEP
jgi:uncharacterized protein YndB with AHSA1/START domain